MLLSPPKDNSNLFFDPTESNLDLQYAMGLTNPQPVTLLQVGDQNNGAFFQSIICRTHIEGFIQVLLYRSMIGLMAWMALIVHSKAVMTLLSIPSIQTLSLVVFKGIPVE